MQACDSEKPRRGDCANGNLNSYYGNIIDDLMESA